MSHFDIDQFLRETAPDANVCPGAREAMAATARTVQREESTRRTRANRRKVGIISVVGLGALSVGAVVLTQYPASENPATTALVAEDKIELLASTHAPSDLPLPDGVTLDDAKANAVRLLRDNPDLRKQGSYVLDKGQVVRSASTTKVPSQLQESGISATYVFYARCQWNRVALEEKESLDEVFAALETLGDSAAFEMDGESVRRRVDQEGVGAVPSDTKAIRVDFDTNCKGGFGEAPGADK
jgi:hypothetical protein